LVEPVVEPEPEAPEVVAEPVAQVEPSTEVVVKTARKRTRRKPAPAAVPVEPEPEAEAEGVLEPETVQEESPAKVEFESPAESESEPAPSLESEFWHGPRWRRKRDDSEAEPGSVDALAEGGAITEFAELPPEPEAELEPLPDLEVSESDVELEPAAESEFWRPSRWHRKRKHADDVAEPIVEAKPEPEPVVVVEEPEPVVEAEPELEPAPEPVVVMEEPESEPVLATMTAGATVEGEPDSESRERGRMVRLGFGFALAVVALIVLVVVIVDSSRPGSGESDRGQSTSTTHAAPPSTNPPGGVGSSDPVKFAPVALPSGMTVNRTWRVSGDNGDTFLASVDVYNGTGQTKTDAVVEVIPKELAETVTDVKFFGKTPEVLQPDPIVNYNVTVAPGDRVRFGYRIAVPPDGAKTSRVEWWKAQRDAEQTALDLQFSMPLPKRAKTRNR
jgi:hypothetical protein